MSALYPAPSPSAVAWLAALRAALASLADQVPPAPALDMDAVAFQLEAEAPEAAEFGDALVAALDGFAPIISGLTAAFELRASTILIALGRGQEIGEIDPVVRSAAGEVAEVRSLTSSGTVTIEKDGRATTLVAATTVAAPVGPVRVDWPDRDDVWLCAVHAAASPVLTARAALERILPHVGVGRAHLRISRTSATSPTSPASPASNVRDSGSRWTPGTPDPEHPHTGPQNPPAALHAALLAIDPTTDPELVMARLEGWRAALEQLHRGAVAIHWEQA